ncbi:BTAD domain-containing putative transcriptional regulator [Cohnella boryungensis]|uniref:BTAD domain-containing putative transcriptional regulator n=1 Tax=Cohnella boryungensis TaxID=768479 RepID=A0ABV8SCW2_9BACL
MLRAIIVDDEELSVKRLSRILSESGRIGACHTFLNPGEAYEFARLNSVDVAFLDISMPEINGLKLSAMLSQLGGHTNIVFVTSYDEFALQAFELNAIDYLLKPVTAERLNRALDKIRRVQRTAPVEQLLEVFLFNGFKIRLPDREQELLKLRSPKTEELFALLLCKEAASREEIIDTLWPDLHYDKALNNLNTNLYYIRKALGESKARAFIQSTRNEIRIDRTAVYCDLYEFQRLLKEAQAGSGQLAEVFKQAEALYAGGLLQGKAYEWAGSYAHGLERDYIELLEKGARFHANRKELHASLHYFEGIVKLDPMREDAQHEIIRLYVQLGRNGEALRRYRDVEKLLRRELGTDPDPRIKALISSLK